MAKMHFKNNPGLLEQLIQLENRYISEGDCRTQADKRIALLMGVSWKTIYYHLQDRFRTKLKERQRLYQREHYKNPQVYERHKNYMLFRYRNISHGVQVKG